MNNIQIVIQAWQLAIAVVAIGLTFTAILVSSFWAFWNVIDKRFDKIEIDLKEIKEAVSGLKTEQAVQKREIEHLSREQEQQRNRLEQMVDLFKQRMTAKPDATS
jgi:F0F1-type ATP synthase membrane subunit b/b'